VGERRLRLKAWACASNDTDSYAPFVPLTLSGAALRQVERKAKGFAGGRNAVEGWVPFDSPAARSRPSPPGEFQWPEA